MWGVSVLKTKEQALRDNKEEHDKVIRAYLTVSLTEAGKIVLEDLVNFCGQNRPSICETLPNNDQTNFNEGKRRVWLRINGLITEGKNVG